MVFLIAAMLVNMIPQHLQKHRQCCFIHNNIVVDVVVVCKRRVLV